MAIVFRIIDDWSPGGSQTAESLTSTGWLSVTRHSLMRLSRFLEQHRPDRRQLADKIARQNKELERADRLRSA